MSARHQSVEHIERLFFEAHCSDYAVAIQELEVRDTALLGPRQLLRREQRVVLAAFMKVEVRDEETTLEIQSGYLITIACESKFLDCGLLGLSLCGRNIRFQDPLVETLVSHLVEVPETDQSFGVSADIEGQVRVRLDCVGVIFMGDFQVRIRFSVVNVLFAGPSYRWLRLRVDQKVATSSSSARERSRFKCSRVVVHAADCCVDRV